MQGIASDLLRLVERRARELSCRAMYLHVLAVYNRPAIAFYHRHGFWDASLLQGFYNIRHCAGLNLTFPFKPIFACHARHVPCSCTGVNNQAAFEARKRDADGCMSPMQHGAAAGARQDAV